VRYQIVTGRTKLENLHSYTRQLKGLKHLVLGVLVCRAAFLHPTCIGISTYMACRSLAKAVEVDVEAMSKRGSLDK
jgi:hypothetical protein